ncbi:MAG: hypothetical protein DMG49_12985 [Acidobacteria bacterium]|nr:MAG: hypothetical protein DMG49_12985 [Acidobacteriota bacterium]
MPNFLETILAQLKRADGRVVLREIRGDQFVSVTGRELLDQVQLVRMFIQSSGVQPGDRCALLAANSVRWAVFHLALMAEGVIVVPLYSRQAPAELVGMMKDCQPRLIFVNEATLGEGMAQTWPEAPRRVLFDEVLRQSAPQPPLADAPNPREASDIVTIIYTSGTSGEPKGVCLTVGNLTHMLSCTTERLDQLMGATNEPDRVFHYLPFNFAASTILLLSCLTRESILTLSTDLNRFAHEINLASPNYFLNVPTVLERVRRGVEDAIAKRPAVIRSLFAKARTAWQRQHLGVGSARDAFWLALGRGLIFRKIRERLGAHLRALICGSAPLALETQQGICTLDDPRVPVEPGCVGTVITGIEMKIGENEEIVVRGPHIFPGYWNRPEETARVLQEGWFHTGDQGEVNVRANWRISGRIKNLIILNSGHKVAPEPIEEKIAQLLPAAQQVVVVGNGRGYLCAFVTGEVESTAVQAALDTLNSELPHYRQVRNFIIVRDVFTPENGLLTANGKLRRDAINARYASEINAMYDSKGSREAVSRQHA